MTLKDLRRIIDIRNGIVNDKHIEEQKESIRLQSQKFSILNLLPFWISDKEEHIRADIANEGRCCWNHVIGLPTKDGRELPIFDYEVELVEALKNHKSIFVKKARGLGITEILLRWMAYLATYDNSYSGCRFSIVCGPRIQTAESYIDRLYYLFANGKLEIECPRAGPIITINNTLIQAFPSHTISTLRGYTNVKFILIDEAAFFIKSQQEEVRAVCEAYGPKTDPLIVMVSTPYKPGDMFEQIDRDPNSIFKKLSFHYSRGLGKIYDPEEIEREKGKPYWRREFELAYAYGTGNVFNELSIVAAENLGKQYFEKRAAANFWGTPKSMGIDPGAGDSKFAFTVIEYVDGIAHVTYSKQFERALFDDMLNTAYDLIQRFDLRVNNKVFVDASQVEFIRSLKNAIGEFTGYERFVERSKEQKTPLYFYMDITPIPFNSSEVGGRVMLGNVRKWLDRKCIAISPDEFPELLTELRIAQSDELMKLDKTDYSMDLLDSLLLACQYLKNG